ncbi:MAG: hypothetical protein PHH70_02420 [Candidatus Gracilibacteria bacterium]|nr:hypothetical protein [Candidatus Gracilibacteria bacterium]
MADTQVKTQDPATQVATTDSKVIALGALEKAEIEQTFAEAKDFRSIGEKITAPLDSIISETARIIDRDPIMNVNDELQTMNTSVQAVYKEIIDNDGTVMKIAKSIPLISGLAKTLDAKWDEASFNVKSLEGKIGVIFSGFDQAYSSLNTSIDMQKSFLDGIDANIGKVVAYKEFLGEKLVEFKAKAELTTTEDEKMKYDMFLRNVEFFQSNLVVLIGNLELARKRLLIRLDSAAKLSLAMNSSRPIFKTLLSTALIETSSQKALEASIKAIGVMGETIDKMSSGLTDKAIESNRKAEEMSSKSVLSTSVFIENVTKLKNHFEEIDAYRAQVKIEADKEQALFAEAKTKLDGIKTISKASQEELAAQLSQ